MLETLHIKNLVIIEKAEIEFGAGLNILSGETGAGKSIILDAIALLLGDRARIDLIQTGQEEAIIEGYFSLDPKADAHTLTKLRENGYTFQETKGTPVELILRRVLSRQGKHRIWINGELAPLVTLQKISEDLIDLCSQHEHQTLHQPRVQFEILDRFADSETLFEKYSHVFSQWSELQRKIASLRLDSPEHLREYDFLKFQKAEIEALAPVIGEDETLQGEKTELANFKNQFQLFQKCSSLLSDESEGALEKISRLEKEIGRLENPELEEKIRLARSLLEDASYDLEKKLSSQEFSEEKLESVSLRLSALNDLKRKYGPTLDEVLQSLNKICERVDTFENLEIRKAELAVELAATSQRLQEAGQALMKKRRKEATVFSKRVTQVLHELAMPDAEFVIEWNGRSSPDATHAVVDGWSALGPETMKWKIRTNRGDVADELSKIASGGELSRVMLAIQETVSLATRSGVYLFDEIDSGMSGQTAFSVGQKLKKVSSHSQVICITHLPQVAAFADFSFRVLKHSDAHKTRTHIQALNAAEKTEEVARMLGGPKPSAKAMENAKEMLQLARSSSKKSESTASRPDRSAEKNHPI